MVIYISTPEQLQAINNNLTGDFELVNDIDMSGIGFTPIGDGTTSYRRFKGSFDGKGYKIKNLTINRTTTNTGLFGMCENATIKNLALEDCNIVSTQNYSGGLVGQTLNTTISNCYVTGFVKGRYGVGALVGWFTNTSKINDCYTTATIEGVGRCGGLVGNSTSNSNSINNCYTLSNIFATDTSYPAGALLGDNAGGATDINNLYYNIDIFNISDYGTGLTTAQFADSSNFPTFNNTIWGFADYPYLKLFGTPTSPSKQETITLNTSYLMPIQFVETFKRKVVVSVSTSRKINSTLSKALITSVASTVENILSSIEIKENANVKSYTLNSELIPIDSSVDTSKKVTKVLTSTLEPLQSIIEVIIPNDIEKPIYANVYAIENNTNSYTLQNPSNIYEIENPTRLEVI